MSIIDRIKNGWNAFRDDDSLYDYRSLNKNDNGIGIGYYSQPFRARNFVTNERMLINSVINKIAIDCSSITILHAQLDENNRYINPLKSGLNNCLTLSANIDQTGRAFRQDVFQSLLLEGVIAVVPVDTDIEPKDPGSYDILTARVGKVIEWYPQHVKINLFNDRINEREDIILPKKSVAIVENPFFSVMNERNSTMQRLNRKLSLLDVVDEQSSAGKLDMIIQLPYVIKSQARKDLAEERRKDLETQLANSKYGIAYTDGTERITQLNRPVENNLMKQVEYLTSLMFSQLGMTQEILDGTANESVMTNYMSRIVEPIVAAVTDEFNRKFLTQTARTQRKAVIYFMNPFKLVSIEKLATVADTFTRNEIMTSNEIRQIIGLKPATDPSADELRNKNLNASQNGQTEYEMTPNEESEDTNYTDESVDEE